VTITVWQHVEFEAPSAIADWAESRGHYLDIVRADYDEPFAVKDALVVLGGPMSVYDGVPYLSAEKAALKSYINRGGKVFGVCLGAQLIAEALGGKVYPSGTREAGWRAISFLPHALTGELGDEAVVFHWHGDTFDLPPGATLLASNDAFQHQSFCAKDGRVIATQFHFETTLESLRDILEADSDYLRHDSPFVQDIEQIMNDAKYIPKANALLYRLLDTWTSLK
jgi:GMP synthase-like glutamine amidotransferase